MSFIKIEISPDVHVMLTAIKKRYNVKSDYDAIIKALLLSSGSSWPVVQMLDKAVAENGRLKSEILSFNNSISTIFLSPPMKDGPSIS